MKAPHNGLKARRRTRCRALRADFPILRTQGERQAAGVSRQRGLEPDAAAGDRPLDTLSDDRAREHPPRGALSVREGDGGIRDARGARCRRSSMRARSARSSTPAARPTASTSSRTATAASSSAKATRSSSRRSSTTRTSCRGRCWRRRRARRSASCRSTTAASSRSRNTSSSSARARSSWA